MNTMRLLTVAACAALLLGACTPRPKLTEQQVKSVVGLTQDQVQDRIGSPESTTNAGDSIWWEYIGITRPNGTSDGACHVVFKKDVVTEVKC